MSYGEADISSRNTSTRRSLSGVIMESAGLMALGAFLMCFAYSEFGTPTDTIGTPGHDSFYHAKMASMLPEYGLVDTFPWLQNVYWVREGEAFVSHHYGYHVMLVPFVKLSEWITGDSLPGGRWANCFFLGINLVLFNLLLRAGGVRFRAVWIALFVLMPFQFYTRHVFVRAIGPSLIFMQAILWLLFTRRYLWAAVLVALYNHLYLGALPYQPFLVGFFVFSTLILGIGRTDEKFGHRLREALLITGLAGTAYLIGVLTYPYGGVIEFLRMQMFNSGISPDVPVGGEWKPYEGTWWFAQMCAVVLIVWAFAAALRLATGTRLERRGMTLLLIHFFFFMMTLKMRRFIEYWPPFCLLSAAYLAAPTLSNLTDRLGHRWGLYRVQGARFLLSWPVRASVAALGMAVLAAATAHAGFAPVSHWFRKDAPRTNLAWQQIRRDARCKYNLPVIREMMAYIREHSEPGEIIFTDDWDIFPVFFYANHHNYYNVGLDPAFTNTRRPDLWQRYVKITRGQVPATVVAEMPDGKGGKSIEQLRVELEDIRDHFKARWVICDRDHRALANLLAKAPALARVVWPADSYDQCRNAEYIVFRIYTADETPQAVPLPTPDAHGHLYLGDLRPISVEQGWGTFRVDRSVEDNPIRLAERVYRKGLGTHALSRLLYAIPEGMEWFEATVGIDSGTLGQGTIVASIQLDGHEVWRSPVLRGHSDPAVVRIPLEQTRQILLLAEPTPDGNRFDHVNWAAARFVAKAAPDPEPAVPMASTTSQEAPR